MLFSVTFGGSPKATSFPQATPPYLVISRSRYYNMSNFLNQDFGSEEEDDDFNPVVAEESEGEDAKVGRP